MLTDEERASLAELEVDAEVLKTVVMKFSEKLREFEVHLEEIRDRDASVKAFGSRFMIDYLSREMEGIKTTIQGINEAIGAYEANMRSLKG